MWGESEAVYIHRLIRAKSKQIFGLFLHKLIEILTLGVSSLLLFLFLTACFVYLFCDSRSNRQVYFRKSQLVGYFSLREMLTVLQLVDEDETERGEEIFFF